MAALTACTVAEASTHAATTEAIKTEATTTTAGENTHAPSNRLEDILQRGYIEIATEPYFAPNEFIDPTITGEDNIVGSDIELAKFIANDLGVELRLKPMDFTSVLGSMTSGKFDMAISALAYTPSRAETMNLSKGYYYGSEDPQKAYGILIRAEDADEIKTIEDLADKTVAAQNGSLQEMFVREQIPAYKQYNQVSSTNDAFLMVQTGRADAMAAALKMAELYLESNPECGLMILPDFYFTVDLDTQGTRIGLPLGEDELTDRVNEIIDKVLEQDLYNQWYEEYKEYAKKLGLEG
jgi:polar amino acid transport system substrate-binding protein